MIIPIILGDMFNFIKESYTGGSVDVYKPTINFKENIISKVFRYDVNSLYPFAMKHFLMPVGKPANFSEGGWYVYKIKKNHSVFLRLML